MVRFQISLRTSLLIITAVAILLAVALELNRRIEDLAANGYRVQAAGDLLVDYLEDVGTWPKDWDVLHQYVEDHKSTLRSIPNISDLRAHVRIDFEFDPSDLNLRSKWSKDKQPFVVVSSRYGRTAGATHNPNEYIHDYLRGVLPRSNAKKERPNDWVSPVTD
jgi:hypothetical protein